MKLREVREHRQDLMQAPTGDQGATFQDLSEGQAAPSRLAAGYLNLGAKYRLEIRVQSEFGAAYRAAINKLRELGDDVRLLISELVQLPRRTETEGEKVADRKLIQRSTALTLGLSVAHADAYAGSLGYFGKRGGELGFMSAAHVLAPLTKNAINVTEENHYIYQPGKPDADPVPDGLCGKLAAHIALSSQTTNSFDAAFAHITKGWETDGNIVPPVKGVPKTIVGQSFAPPVSSKAEDHEGATVLKIGRTTAYTMAQIGAVDVLSTDVSRVGAGTYKFDGVVEVFQPYEGSRRPQLFARAGDSGACYILQEGLRPIALHIAGGSIVKEVKMLRSSANGATEPTVVERPGYVAYGGDLLSAMKQLGVKAL